ncbi:MAG: hypothetical protein AAF806_18570 [Bacteroidota bacterium]
MIVTYLATSLTSYEKIQAIEDLKEWVVDAKINFIVVDIEQEKIVQWISY